MAEGKSSKIPYDMALGAEMQNFYADPLGYVMFNFPWDTDTAIQLVKLEPEYRDRFDCEYGPDRWACEFLDQLGDEIYERGFDGKTAVDPIQFATVSGHGIGKSTLSAWLIKFILDTRPFARGVVTANTDTQLRTKTWGELGKWHAISLTRDWFDYNAGRGSLSLAHKVHKVNWRVDGITCREENSEAFAGLHAANSTPFYLFDEASGVPDGIFEVREGGTTDGEPMIFDFGNGTRKSGRFFEECVGTLAKQFIVRSVDSRTVQITNKRRIQAWVDHYGEDSDFCKVRVRGMFPAASSMQFIGSDLVDDAMRRPVVTDRFSPLVIGVDVARGGTNDSVIYPRVGNDARTHGYKKFNSLDGPQLAREIIKEVTKFREMGLEPQAIFVDETGVGYSVLDHLRFLGYNPLGVQFGGKVSDPRSYRFKGDEIWGTMRDAIRDNLCIANTAELKRDLTQREFGYTAAGNKLNLERKIDMMARGLVSPDIADALALTFTDKVAPLGVAHGAAAMKARTTVHDYDPIWGELP